MGYFEDGDSGLPIRTKINNIAQLFSLTTTNGNVTAGTITSITIHAINASVSSKVALSGQSVYIVDLVTGEMITVVLSANWEKNDTSISINSYVLTDDLADGSFIFIPFHNVASYAFNS